MRKHKKAQKGERNIVKRKCFGNFNIRMNIIRNDFFVAVIAVLSIAGFLSLLQGKCNFCGFYLCEYFVQLLPYSLDCLSLSCMEVLKAEFGMSVTVLINSCPWLCSLLFRYRCRVAKVSGLKKVRDPCSERYLHDLQIFTRHMESYSELYFPRGY